MSTPHKCPACDGLCKRARKPEGKLKRCRACDGRGVVWEPASSTGTVPWQHTWPYANVPYQQPFTLTGVDDVSGAGDVIPSVATTHIYAGDPPVSPNEWHSS